LSKISRPIWHKAGSFIANRQPLEFRTLSQRMLGFRNRLCKLNQRPPRFRMLNRQTLRDRDSEPKMPKSGSVNAQYHRPTGNRKRGAATKHQHSPVNVKDFGGQSQESSGGKTGRLLNTGSLTGAQFSCESSVSKRVDMKEGSEVIQRREDAKTTTPTGSSARCDITSATPARHGEPSKDRRRSRTDQRSSERKNV